jgi:hypothetical protein
MNQTIEEKNKAVRCVSLEQGGESTSDTADGTAFSNHRTANGPVLDNSRLRCAE